MVHRPLGLYRPVPPHRDHGGPKRLAQMRWTQEGTDRAEDPNSTRIRHHLRPLVEEVHLQCPLHDPRFRDAALIQCFFDIPGETGKLREIREVTPTAIVECVSSIEINSKDTWLKEAGI